MVTSSYDKFIFLYNLICVLSDAIFNMYVTLLIYIQENTAFLRNLRNRIICIRSEPPEAKWISISCIRENSRKWSSFYYDDPNSILFRWFIYSNYNDHYEWFEEYIPRINFDKTLPVCKYDQTKFALTTVNQLYSPIIIAKQDHDYQVVKLMTPTLTLTDIDNSLIFKSHVSFLCILYTNPNVKGEIPLKIPKSCYYVGNQILSATFVYRLLQYTVGYMFYFDLSYQLKLIDSQMKYLELNCNEYIELKHNSYIKQIVFEKQ